MRVKFNKQTTVDLLDHNDESYPTSKTFYNNEVVECVNVEESVKGFVDIIFENGDVAVGVNKQGLTIL